VITRKRRIECTFGIKKGRDIMCIICTYPVQHGEICQQQQKRHHSWLRSVKVYHVSGGPTHGHKVIHGSDAVSVLVESVKRIKLQVMNIRISSI
jgi:hypothetical protein